jgi:hypothetical protein
LKPEVAVISTEDGNNYGHPSSECLGRLHPAKIRKTYWTERGAGAEPDTNQDIVAESAVIVEIAAVGSSFTVTYGRGKKDTYAVWPAKAWQPQKPSKSSTAIKSY